MGTSERNGRYGRIIAASLIRQQGEIATWSGESGNRITEEDRYELMLDSEERNDG